MKRHAPTLCGVLFAVLSATAANAADLPSKAPAYSGGYFAPFSWSGFYVGINGGYGFGKSNWTATAGGTTGDFNVTGALAGGTVGYNMQTGVWVWGLEGDLDYSTIKGSTSSFCPGGCETGNDWLGTARGRIGYAWGNWLPYITGGAAFGDIKMTPPAPDTYTSKIKVGWTAGLGVEYAFMGPWSAKLEYLYTDLGTASCGSASCIAAGGINVKLNTNIVRAGVNYRF